jgi:DNA-binding MarR family transcriptional regulator/N-acetylglutamate synthase-like GNAT family acetyltransferase
MPRSEPGAVAGARAARIDAVRRFNRFYTQRIGVLGPALWGSDFSLAEVRVLWELAHRADGAPPPTATQLGRELGLDPGYLSRILARFVQRGWVARTPAAHDARCHLIELTARGRRAFAPIERRSADEVAALLRRLDDGAQDRLVGALRAVESMLGDAGDGDRAAPRLCVLRAHRPGDLGWMIQRHAELYRQEYGWDETFEALVAEIGAKFIREFKPGRERCWIAERDGERVGCVYLVQKSKRVAQLRLLLVEPSARGGGLGRQLVGECIRFARDAGYATLMLWTNDCLHAARRIYQKAGFRLVREEKHRSFGHDLVGQFWELNLRGAGPAGDTAARGSA